MATKTVKVCDVCKKVIDGVELCTIKVSCNDGKNVREHYAAALDMCPLHLERVTNRIKGGIVPSKSKPRKSKAEAA